MMGRWAQVQARSNIKHGKNIELFRPSPQEAECDCKWTSELTAYIQSAHIQHCHINIDATDICTLDNFVEIHFLNLYFYLQQAYVQLLRPLSLPPLTYQQI